MTSSWSLSAGEGFAPGRLALALDVVRHGVGQDPAADAYPGAVIAVARGGELAVAETMGSALLAPVPEELRWDSVFDAASLTKVVALTPLVLMFLERGLICLDDRLERFFPETRTRALGMVTLAQLLTHTSGLPGWVPLYDIMTAEPRVVAAIAGTSLGAAPGARVEYSCANFIILGLLVEKIAGLSLAELFAQEISTPLGMNDTRFLPLGEMLPQGLRRRLVPTELRLSTERGQELDRAIAREGRWTDAWSERHPGGYARGVVDDENAAYLGGVAGNAGLFTTAADLLTYGQMWLDEGACGTRQILSPATVAAATRNRTLELEGGNRGLGWQLPAPETAFGDLASAACFGHTGFTGTALWIDPDYQLVAVLLTNRLQFGRSNERVLRIRRLFFNSLISSLR